MMNPRVICSRRAPDLYTCAQLAGGAPCGVQGRGGSAHACCCRQEVHQGIPERTAAGWIGCISRGYTGWPPVTHDGECAGQVWPVEQQQVTTSGMQTAWHQGGAQHSAEQLHRTTWAGLGPHLPPHPPNSHRCSLQCISCHPVSSLTLAEATQHLPPLLTPVHPPLALPLLSTLPLPASRCPPPSWMWTSSSSSPGTSWCSWDSLPSAGR